MTRACKDPRQLLAFIIGAGCCAVVSIPLSAAIVGGLGLRPQAASMAVASSILSALLLAWSAILLRYQGAPFAALGLPTTTDRMRELAFGTMLSVFLFFAVACVQSWVVDATWEFGGAPGALSALKGLMVASSMVLAEELLFRGVMLRSLRQMYGDRTAILFAALLFGAYHLVSSGDWAMGAVFRFVMPTLGGLLFGWAAIRSAGLALPIGLHLGGNWVQAFVVGFEPVRALSVPERATTLWRVPITGEDLRLLTAPDLLPRLPYLVAMVVAAMVTWQFMKRNMSQIASTS